MNRDRSIQAQSIMKAVVPAVARPDWRAAVLELLAIHDEIVGSAPEPADRTPKTPPAGVTSGETARGYLKTCTRDSPTKVYAVIDDDNRGVMYQGSAWRAHGDAIERIPIGAEIEVVVKVVEKDGKRFTNFESAREVPKPSPAANAPRFDEIPF